MGNARIKGWTTRSCNQGQKPASKSGKLSAANAWADCSSIIIDKPPDFEVALPKQPLNRYVGAEWASLFAATLPRVPKPVGRDLRRQTSRSPVRPLFSSAAEYYYQTRSIIAVARVPTFWRQTLPERGFLSAGVRPTARSWRKCPLPECSRDRADLTAAMVVYTAVRGS